MRPSSKGLRKDVSIAGRDHVGAHAMPSKKLRKNVSIAGRHHVGAHCMRPCA
jgi:hypothetical protein